VGLLFTSSLASSEDRSASRSHASWWIQNYGVLTSSEEPLIQRAEKVFERVVAAADKKGNRVPRLLIVPGEGNPYALALQDGTILLTRKGLRICYEKSSHPDGDARLAFLLGHELAHLAKDDFWHLSAFTAIQSHGKGSKVSESVAELIRSISDLDPGAPRSLEAARLKELQADSYGIIYMSMAGFDSSAIIDAGGSNFFEHWISQITGQVAYSESTHPSPAERAEIVRSQLASVREDIDLFRFGVRLYQLGRYEDAILLLERFLERFPSREVYNNLGLCHYQIAFRTLIACNPSLAHRFKLVTLIDPDTIARGLERAGETRAADHCVRKPEFLDRIRLAASHFEHASRLDPSYAPAMLNLSSTWILSEAHAKALGVLGELLDRDPDNVRALNNKAVALYAYGLESGIDAVTQSMQMLESAVRKEPEFADAYYNLAAIQSERGRNAAARKNWEAFLLLEPSGGHSSVISMRLNPESKAEEDKLLKAVQRKANDLPFPLGPIDGNTEKEIKGMKHRNVEIGSFHGQIRKNGKYLLLIIDDALEVVEVLQDPPVQLHEFEKEHGKPRKIVERADGQTFVYNNFAADASDGVIKSITYFEE
jgi:tetratricopeptide (TPR) repeat protein